MSNETARSSYYYEWTTLKDDSIRTITGQAGVTNIATLQKNDDLLYFTSGLAVGFQLPNASTCVGRKVRMYRKNSGVVTVTGSMYYAHSALVSTLELERNVLYEFIAMPFGWYYV